MRIAFIGHERIPSRKGGIGIIVDGLAIRMVTRGEQVAVYNRKGHNVIGEEFDNQSSTNDKPYMYRGVKVTPVTTIGAKEPAAFTPSFFATSKTIKVRPDVIRYHAEGPCVPLRLTYQASIRTVVTIHGLDWQRTKWDGSALMYLELGERTAVGCVDEVIALNRGMQQYFRDTYGREAHLTPNGIAPVESVPPDMITNKWSLEKDSYILSLGRTVPEKGVHYLIGALKRLDTDKKLVTAGGASDSAEYYESIEQAVARDQRIILTGSIEGREFEELYSNAYIYILPSDLEGMLMSLLEALAYGCCYLISNIVEYADVLCDESGMMHGVTFRRGGVNDLADKLGELLVDVGKVREIKTGAASYITGHYSQDKAVQVTLKLCRRADK